MQDLYLPIAHALARPLHYNNTHKGATLYQLWRADFAALCQLALTCRDAALSVRRLLWADTALGARERARRAQVERARAFMRLPTVPVSASWTRSGIGAAAHLRSRTTVSFNGRIRIREYYFPGRQERRWRKYNTCIKWRSPLAICVGITLITDAEEQRGRILIWHCGCKQSLWTGTFTDHYGALGGMKGLTALGREHWGASGDAMMMKAYLRFETIVAAVHAP
jgi:hypothetical protein